jgi:hypothetical protein
MSLSISNLEDDRIKIGITNERSKIISIFFTTLLPPDPQMSFSHQEKTTERDTQSNVDREPLLVGID